MFFFKIEWEYWAYLKSFLEYLNRIPEFPRTVLHDISADETLLDELNGL